MSSEEDNWWENFGVKEGAPITTSKATYKIDKMLGEGGFGAVFMVRDEATQKEYAMKIEKKIETRKDSKLKMEIAILKLVEKERGRDRNHFTEIIDRSKKDGYFLLIMQLVGKCLDDLKRQYENKVFRLATGLGVSIQCLEAVEDLHKHSFLHRDLKPENYACGLPPHMHTIYILDFGIARRYTNDKGELKTPRNYVRFKGTIRFASLACHKNIEMSMKDDVESWFYLLLDLIQPMGLPWKRLKDKNEVERAKEMARQQHDLLYGPLKLKDEYHQILTYIDKLEYTQRVDYSYIYEKLKRIAVNQKLNVDDRYDFEDNPFKKSPH